MTTEIFDITALKQEGLSVVEIARAMVVSTPAEASNASGFRRTLKTFEKKVKGFFKPHKQRIDEVHAALCADEKRVLAPALEGLSLLDLKLNAYQNKTQREAIEERQRREAAARKLAEDQALTQAQAAQAAGDHEEAETILDTPVEVPAIKAPKPEKIDGLHFRTDYFGVVEDLKSVIMAVVAGKAPLILIMVDPSALKKFAGATKGAVQVPGIRFGSKQIPVSK